MIILDTNIISEMMRPQPDAAVMEWLSAKPISEFATTAINIAELRYGLARLPAGRRKRDLELKFSSLVSQGFANRVFAFDGLAAEAYGDMAATRERNGRRLEGFDGLVAAIALSRGASIATRDTSDFDGSGIEIVNPWRRQPHSKL